MPAGTGLSSCLLGPCTAVRGHKSCLEKAKFTGIGTRKSRGGQVGLRRRGVKKAYGGEGLQVSKFSAYLGGHNQWSPSQASRSPLPRHPSHMLVCTPTKLAWLGLSGGRGALVSAPQRPCQPWACLAVTSSSLARPRWHPPSPPGVLQYSVR